MEKPKKILTDIEFKIKLCRKHQMPIFKYEKQCPNCNGLGVDGYDKKSLPIPCKCVSVSKVDAEMVARKKAPVKTTTEVAK